MSDYKEKFEKMRVAGKFAAQTLDMLNWQYQRRYINRLYW